MNLRIAVSGVLFALVISVPAHAQGMSISFDALRAAHAADSLRSAAMRRQSANAKLVKAKAAKSDSIKKQRRELNALRPVRVALGVTPTPAAPAQSQPSVEIDSEPQSPQSVTYAPAVAPRIDTIVVAAKPAAPAPAAPKPAAPTPAAPKAAAPAAALPVTLTGMFQFWMTAGDAGFRNTYRLRRAELKATGAASPKVSWVVMLDFGKSLSASSTTTSSGAVQTSVAQNGRALQDATILFQATPDLRIDAGQQKVPFGLEGSQSSGTLEMVERALFMSDRSRGASYGDVRDLGVALRGRWRKSLDYSVGVFNGSGESQNDTDANLAKAVIGRLVVRPWSAVQLGVSGVYAGTGAGDAPRRDRNAAEIRIRTGRVLLQAEAASGHDGALSRRGGYAHAGFRVRPSIDLHARFDGWDPDVKREADAASATERALLGGVTWAVPATAIKLQADVARRTYSSALAPSRLQLMLNLQTNW